MRLTRLKQFIRLESSSGIFLFGMAVLALALSNSSWSNVYQKIFQTQVFHEPLLFWINDGLMTLFFLLVGLELKRELLFGELSRWSQVVLPGCAALGGMVVPACLYLWMNHDNPLALKGWAIPVATDIAFALGILSLFGKRVPLGLKLFLMSLAIFDDVGAILIIGFFHATALSYVAMLVAGISLAILFCLNRMGIKHFAIYAVMGMVLWFSILQSGLHPTIAGVLLAFLIPSERLAAMERKLHPWVAYGIVPLFALANAGLSLSNVTWSMLAMGIALALFVGKQMGVLGVSWLVIRLKRASLPSGVNWLQLYGVSLLCGIGFTMSLFLGTLAFQGNNVFIDQVKLGVLVGSILSGVAGSIILYVSLKKGEQSFESK